MKRTLVWTIVTVVATLVGSTAVGAVSGGAGLTPLAASELSAVTGGMCTGKCSSDPVPEPEPYRTGSVWQTLKVTPGPAEQLSYGVYTEVSNVAGKKALSWSVSVNDNCRYRWTSGGVGISTGFQVQVGTTYSCAATISLKGTLNPGYRVKIYKGDMRQVTTVTMGLFDLYSDGSLVDTGKRDTGKEERTWHRYTPVEAKGN